ncbi:ABC-2 type transport system ATP-binding protein [Kribbella sp. VKM Ac-2527]|uniref:ABC-2 type transport system ATP-binding protein n=1 Tax=Kribbella caucasensis TaxID=2512215 RepID=A0A4R6KHU5_9ACTN|nr:ATP-binding cassette domain-containing protein [Kribbella sp. VKM Ac-2527]TDO50584.1 ABC-2 type transport system ATP-binding protein [Kribbella sp. VKM Ac-2527]
MNSQIAVLDGVTKSYNGTEVLHPTDLGFGRGVIGLLGPNGAGKSTMLRLLATAMPPSSGRIVVSGHLVTGGIAERTAARRRLSYLPQEVGIPRRMMSFGFLDYIAVLKEWKDRDTRHREVIRVLGLVGLADRRTKRVSALSGGQRRRLALAQALMGDPDLVVLDEPTTGLDPEQRASLRGILSSYANRGSVLLATHQTEDVSALCDRVIILDEGRIRFDGTVAELIRLAEGQVWVGAEANTRALSSWRTGTGEIRSLGGVPAPGSRPADVAVEDAYLLVRSEITGATKIGEVR